MPGDDVFLTIPVDPKTFKMSPPPSPPIDWIQEQESVNFIPTLDLDMMPAPQNTFHHQALTSSSSSSTFHHHQQQQQTIFSTAFINNVNISNSVQQQQQQPSSPMSIAQSPGVPDSSSSSSSSTSSISILLNSADENQPTIILEQVPHVAPVFPPPVTSFVNARAPASAGFNPYFLHSHGGGGGPVNGDTRNMRMINI